MKEIKKIYMVGTGGVGGLFGAKMIQAGLNVIFVATPRSTEIIKKNGLEIRSIEGDIHLRDVQIQDHYKNEGEDADLVIISVKTHQLDDVMEKLNGLIGMNTMILPILNGVVATRELEKKYGNKTIGGLCKLLSFKLKPGVLKHLGGGMIEIGELDGPITDRIQTIQQVLQKAKIKTVCHDDFLTAQWDKMIMISAYSALGTVTRASFGEICNIPETYEILGVLLEECVKVARKNGAKTSDEIIDKYKGLMKQLPEKGTTSTQRDIIAGVPSEWDYLIGDIVKQGQGLDIPISRAFYYAILPQERRAKSQL